jgi:hypothetical protein
MKRKKYNEILELSYLRKSDLKNYDIKVTDSEWDEIITNMSLVNSHSIDMVYELMKSTYSFEEFLKLLIETKGTFPDSNGISIQHKVCQSYFKGNMITNISDTSLL